MELLQELDASAREDISSEAFSLELTRKQRTELEDELKKQISPLRRKRGDLKRKITIHCKIIIKGDNEPPPDQITIDSVRKEVFHLLEEIKKKDVLIENYITESAITRVDQTLLNEEIMGSTNYHIKMAQILAPFGHNSDRLRKPSFRSCNGKDSVSREEINSILQMANQPREPRLTSLKCKNFSGEQDKFGFRTFLQSFNDVYGDRSDISDAAKLQYLKSHLKSSALKIVEHLPNVNDNFETALNILKEHYLNEPFIKDSLLHFIDCSPVLDGKNLDTIRSFIIKIRAHLQELRELKLDYFVDGSPGCVLISHIVTDKLPSSFLRELMFISGEEYPSINIIFKHHNQVLQSMEKFRAKTFASVAKSSKKSSSLPKKEVGFSRTEERYTYNVFSGKEHDKPTSSPVFPRKNKASLAHCKLCDGPHYMSLCPEYKSPQARREKCVDLGMCSNCSSFQHMADACPAKTLSLRRPCGKCHSRKHITALCSQGGKSPIKFSSSTKTEAVVNKDAPSTS